MIPKTKFLEWIEDYCRDSLDIPDRQALESELLRDEELKKELEFEKSLQTAISEKDILELRSRLQTAAQNQTQATTPFELLVGFENIQQISDTLSPAELLQYYDSLPKAHVYQHELAMNENLHEFYREQNLTEESEDFMDDEFDLTEFEDAGLGEAILEKDILSLRETLSKVAASVHVQCSADEVDAYLNGSLTGSELVRFEQELAVNGKLQREVQLHRELEEAVLEPDIMNLRNALEKLSGTETSWNVSEQQIEAYIDGELEGDELVKFIAEMNDNADLKSEIALREHVNESVGEDDIVTLRSKLDQVKQNLGGREIRSLIPAAKENHTYWWRAGVAVIVVLIAFAGILGGESLRSHQISDDYFSAPQWTPQRAVVADAGVLQQANHLFLNGEYDKALVLYDKAILEHNEKFVFQFYKGSTLHNLGRFREAIPEYSKVIAQGDNIFIEEAEWFKAICYYRLDEKVEAKKQLLAIINRNGFYANEAKSLLRKVKFSIR